MSADIKCQSRFAARNRRLSKSKTEAWQERYHFRRFRGIPPKASGIPEDMICFSVSCASFSIPLAAPLTVSLAPLTWRLNDNLSPGNMHYEAPHFSRMTCNRRTPETSQHRTLSIANIQLQEGTKKAAGNRLFSCDRAPTPRSLKTAANTTNDTGTQRDKLLFPPPAPQPKTKSDTRFGSIHTTVSTTVQGGGATATAEKKTHLTFAKHMAFLPSHDEPSAASITRGIFSKKH